MSTDLYRLTRAGRPLVGKDVLAGDRKLTESELGPYLEPTGLSIDLTPLDEKIEEVMAEESKFKKFDHEIDAELARTVHRVFDITPREAADPGLWHYLTAVQYPEFVCYRWRFNPEKPKAMREKFLGAGKDIYSNALHRLWWIAELTYERGENGEDRDYDRTTRVLEFQELANDIFDRWFGRYRPFAVACADLLDAEVLEDSEPANSSIVSETTTRLREELTVRRVEAMSQQDIEDLIESTRDDVISEL